MTNYPTNQHVPFKKISMVFTKLISKPVVMCEAPGNKKCPRLTESFIILNRDSAMNKILILDTHLSTQIPICLITAYDT